MLWAINKMRMKKHIQFGVFAHWGLLISKRRQLCGNLCATLLQKKLPLILPIEVISFFFDSIFFPPIYDMHGEFGIQSLHQPSVIIEHLPIQQVKTGAELTNIPSFRQTRQILIGQCHPTPSDAKHEE
jgi:hypothetical protein